jgi:hypothetical protein
VLLLTHTINANTPDAGLDDYVDLNQKNIHDNDYHTNTNELDEESVNANTNPNLINKKQKDLSNEDDASKMSLLDLASLSSNSLRIGFEPFYIITNYLIDEFVKPHLPTGKKKFFQLISCNVKLFSFLNLCFCSKNVTFLKLILKKLRNLNIMLSVRGKIFVIFN